MSFFSCRRGEWGWMYTVARNLLISVTWCQMFRMRSFLFGGDDDMMSLSNRSPCLRATSVWCLAAPCRRLQLRAILCFHFNETNSGSFVGARCPRLSLIFAASSLRSRLRPGAPQRSPPPPSPHRPVDAVSLVIKFRHGRRAQLRLRSAAAAGGSETTRKMRMGAMMY